MFNVLINPLHQVFKLVESMNHTCNQLSISSFATSPLASSWFPLQPIVPALQPCRQRTHMKIVEADHEIPGKFLLKFLFT